ncbi:MAG: Ig-like domain-containing protein [Tannerella sp.]|jgi:uncharacterized protein YjdB|nr:Ig-like domain-containing protein [Tannerella sp.]
MKKGILLLVSILFLGISAGAQTVSSITLDSESFSLAVGLTKKLTPEVLPAEADQDVTWSSSNDAIASVDDGMVEAKAEGSATITATASDGVKKATCVVTVTTAVPVSGIKFDKAATLTLNVDSVETLTASFTPSNATDKAVIFTTSDATTVDIASITQDTIIKIKALKAGTATITVKTKNGDKTATCTVTVPPVVVTKVDLGKDTVLVVGDSAILKVTITPNNATEKGVTWESKDPKIATVGTDGKVKAIAVGKTSIIVTSKSKATIKDTCIVEVTAAVIPVASVKLNKDSISIIEGDTFHLAAAILPTNATNRKVTWASNSTAIATVNATTGEVKAIKAGKTLVIVTTDNSSKKDTCIVNVRKKVILIDPVIEAQGKNGSIPLYLNAPDKETLTGSFTIKFPTGVTLDTENTKLTEAFAASSALSITPGSNNTWKVEIKKQELKSMLRALSNQKIMDIAYIVNKNVKKGDLLDVNITNAEFKFTDNTEIKEEGMTFKLKADYTTSNDIIDSEKAYAYAADNRLYIQSAKAETIYVYSLNGTLLYSGEKAEGKISVDLNIQEPIIIVKGSSGWVQKVAK